MKLTLNYIALLFVILVMYATSCKKFLAVQPVDSVSDQVTIVDAAELQDDLRQ